jgi:hypothetical protein
MYGYEERVLAAGKIPFTRTVDLGCKRFRSKKSALAFAQSKKNWHRADLSVDHDHYTYLLEVWFRKANGKIRRSYV